MNYNRAYFAVVTGLGALLLARHVPALLGFASQGGNMPPAIGVILGLVVGGMGAYGLYLPSGASGPEKPTFTFGVIVLAFVLQAVAVAAWLAGLAW